MKKLSILLVAFTFSFFALLGTTTQAYQIWWTPGVGGNVWAHFYTWDSADVPPSHSEYVGGLELEPLHFQVIPDIGDATTGTVTVTVSNAVYVWSLGGALSDQPDITDFSEVSYRFDYWANNFSDTILVSGVKDSYLEKPMNISLPVQIGALYDVKVNADVGGISGLPRLIGSPSAFPYSYWMELGASIYTYDVKVPEPSTMLLLGSGLLGLWGFRRKFKK